MKRLQFLMGFLCGAALFAVVTSTASAAADILARLSNPTVYVDGQQIELEAYEINGYNYVKLRDIGQVVGFNVYWDGNVQIESDKPYTGEPPVKEEAQPLNSQDPIQVGSWKGTSLDVGTTSLLTIPENAKDCTAVSSDPTVLTVQQTLGYWAMTARSPGAATVTVTGPEGRTGSITVTVMPATPTEQEPLVIPEPEPYSEMRLELVRLVNEARKENGVGELVINDALMNAAQICSSRERSWHDNKDECQTALACGYPHGFGSNITFFTLVLDQDVPQHAVDNWLNSPGHKDTMMDPGADSIGVGITRNSRRGVYCYLFVGNPNTHNPYGND